MKRRDTTPVCMCAMALLCVSSIAAPAKDTNSTARPRPLYVVYFTPKDREPFPRWQERLDAIFTDIQQFYRDGMASNGYGPMTFPLERDAQRRLTIHHVRGTRPRAFYTGATGGEMREEVRTALLKEGIDIERETIALIHATAQTKRDRTHGDSPYYGSGSCSSGTAWANDQEWIDLAQVTNRDTNVFYRDRPMSLGAYNSTMIGGIAHELGHALGLPHVRPRSCDTATPLMGSGNYTYRNERRNDGTGSFLSAPSALLLSQHPLFTGAPVPDQPASADLAAFSAVWSQQCMVIHGQVTGCPPIQGIALYADPEGDSDYDAIGYAAPASSSGTFSATVGEFCLCAHELRLGFCHRGGQVSWEGMPCLLSNGVPLIAELMHAYAWNRIRAGIAHADDTRAATILDTAAADPTLDADVRRRAENLRAVIATPRPLRAVYPAPAAVAGTNAWLSDLAWSDAEVGWIGPTRDAVPDSDTRWLMSGDRAHAKGLYAHAPSRYCFDLDRRWKRLAGSCGLQDGHSGSVEFIIRGDGKELFRARDVRDTRERLYAVDVVGVKRLELEVGIADADNGSDWGCWFSPQLAR